MLSNLPMLPPEHTLAHLQATLSNSFEHHIFLNSVGIRSLTPGHPPPYLELALACVGSIFSPAASLTTPTSSDVLLTPSTSEDLFVSGMSLWSVMLEVDNRESRLCAATIAVRMRSHRPSAPTRLTSSLSTGCPLCDIRDSIDGICSSTENIRTFVQSSYGTIDHRYRFPCYANSRADVTTLTFD